MLLFKRAGIAALILLFCLFPINLSAQCCVAGNPSSSADSHESGGKNTLDISLGNLFSYSDTYYQGTEVLNNYKYIKDSYFNFSSLTLSYGLTDKLKISAEIGYYINKIQNFDFGAGQTFNRKAFGLGDGTIGISYKIYSNRSNTFTITPSVRATLPIGTFDQIYNSVVLPIDLQPSSGGYKYEGGLMFFKRFENSKLSLFSANTFEYSQRINTERTKYKYGNLYNFSLFGIYNISKQFTGILKIRAQVRDKAMNDENNLIESTGGFTLFVSPQIDFNFSDSWKLSMQLETPIFRDLNGIQLSNKYAVSARISKRIEFGGSTKPKIINDEEAIGADLKKSTILVEGSCSMCKSRIESVAVAFDNVINANWDSETKKLVIAYKNTVNIDEIKKALADAGHDNESYKASDEVYEKLPECCKYRVK